MMRWMMRGLAAYYRDNIDTVNNGGHVMGPFIGVHLVLTVMGAIGWFVIGSFDIGEGGTIFAQIAWWVRCGIAGVFLLFGGVISLIVTLDMVKGVVAIVVFKDPRYRWF
jgi:hypothetical protein